MSNINLTEEEKNELYKKYGRNRYRGPDDPTTPNLIVESGNESLNDYINKNSGGGDEEKKEESGESKKEDSDKSGVEKHDDAVGGVIDAGLNMLSSNPVGGQIATAASLVRSGMSGDQEKHEKNIVDKAGFQLGLVDFGMDLAGTLGGDTVDNNWDAMTKFQSQEAQQTRDILSVLAPSVMLSAMGVPAVMGAIGKTGLLSNGLVRGMTALGLHAASDVGVTYVSDYSERDTGLMNWMDEHLERWGSPIRIPEAVKVMDGDSIEIRKQKLMWENAGLSVVGDALGYLLSKGKPPMGWFNGRDEAAQRYKKNNVSTNAEPNTVEAVETLQKQIDNTTDSAKKKELKQVQLDLFEQLEESGTSIATKDPLDSYVARMNYSRDAQADDLASVKLSREMEETGQAPKFDKDINSSLVSESSKWQQAKPAGAGVRNAIDTSNLAMGRTKRSNVPAPIYSQAVRERALIKGDSTREALVKPLEMEVKAAGKWDAFLDGVKHTTKSVHDEGLELQRQLIEAGSVDDVKALLFSDKDVKSWGFGSKRFRQEYINDTQQAQVVKAMANLTEMYFSESIQVASARLITTTAKEISAIAESMTRFKGAVDPDRAQSIIFDKLLVLSEEYAINKFIAGFSLKSQGIIKKIKAGSQEAMAALDPVGTQQKIQAYVDQQKQITKQSLKDYNELRQTNPEAARALTKAMDLSGGEVRDLISLKNYIDKEMSFWGLLHSPGGRDNLLTQGLSNLWYNNLLSWFATPKAAIGGGIELSLRPAAYFYGHLRGFTKPKKWFTDMRRGLYAYSAIREATQGSLKAALELHKKIRMDPEAYQRVLRADFRNAGADIADRFEVLNESRSLMTPNKQRRLDWINTNRTINNSPYFRYGMNNMTATDYFTQNMNAYANARFEVFDSMLDAPGQVVSPQMIQAANVAIKNRMFDKDGLLRDSWTKSISDDIALSGDNVMGQLAKKVTDEFPMLRTQLAFGPTGVNQIRRNMQYLPVANLFDGKVRNTLFASDEAGMKRALKMHGIDWDEEPRAIQIFENLQAEYRGRLQMGVSVAALAFGYAMDGNIRGTMPMDPSQRRLWKQNDIKEKSIKLGDITLPFGGLPVLDPILTTLGNMAWYSMDMTESWKEDTLTKIGYTIAASLTEDTVLQSLEPLVEIAAGNYGEAKRLISNITGGFVPYASLNSQLAKAIDGANKDIHSDWTAIFRARIPGLSATVNNKVNVIFGTYEGQETNPMIRAFNLMSPYGVQTTNPETKEVANFLEAIRYPMPDILKYSTESVKYSPAMSDAVAKEMAGMQIWKVIRDKVVRGPGHQEILKDLQQAKSEEGLLDTVRIDPKLTKIYREIGDILKTAKKKAEVRVLANPKYDQFKTEAAGKKSIDNMLKHGNVQDASDAARQLNEQLSITNPNNWFR